MKKITVLFLSTLMIFLTFLTASAKDVVELKLTDVTVYAGDEFEVKLFISDNSQLSGAVIDLEYDANKLEFISAEKGAIIDANAIVSIKNTSKNENYKYIRFTYLSPNSAITSDGILLSVKFKAVADAEGNSSINLSIPSAGDFVNFNAEKLPFAIENSTIKIINTTLNDITENEESSSKISTTTEPVESTENTTDSTNDNNNQNSDENEYVKIVIGLFVAGGLIIFGVVVYIFVIKKKNEVN